MNIYKLVFTALSLTLAGSLCFSDQITVKTKCGDLIKLDIEDEMPFKEAIDQITSQITVTGRWEEPTEEEETSGNDLYILDYSSSLDSDRLNPSFLAATKARDYYHVMNSYEKGELRYILNTLASASWTKLISSNSALKKSGDNIDHIHPLRFWLTIFSDEELKGCIHAVRDRKQIWKEFTSGCVDSFNQEAGFNNLKKEYIANFASALKLKNSKAIDDALKSKNWTEFFNILITNLPRSGNPGRYDM